MFSLNGRGSVISCEVFPPLDLDSDSEYVVGLIDLATYNSVPNIEKGINDTFYIGPHTLTVDEGAYEILDIEYAIQEKLAAAVGNERGGGGGETFFSLKANNNTLKTEITCSLPILFKKPNNMAKLLGFDESRVLKPDELHISDMPVNIMKVNVIRVECNIVRGSYFNGAEGHVIHEFYPLVESGFKIVEVPGTVVYLPVNTRKINTITVSLKDQNGDLVNLRNEDVSVRLHVKRVVEHGAGI